GEQFTIAWTKRFARKIGNHAARFFHEQCSRCRVPRLQSKFPESFEASRRYTAQIERGGSITPYTVRPQRVTCVVSDIRLLVALVRRESCDEQARRQRVDLRHVYAP